MKRKLYELLADERGVTMLEYGLMLAGFGIVITGAMTLVGGEISAAFGEGLTPSLSDRLEQVDIER